MKTKTKLEIIEETVAYYSEDPKRRALIGTACRYLTEDGRMCAFGRCEIDPPTWDQGYVSTRFRRRNVDDALKPDYRGHDIGFWYEVQMLHDRHEYWDDDGITEKGRGYVKTLKERYS